MEDGKRAAEEYGTGNYGKAAVDLIAGTLNAALDWTPAQKLALLIGAGARTFPWRMVKHAEQMEKAGKSPEEIWRAAGLERGADGYWRAEISDRGYRLRPKVGTLDSEGFRTAGLFEQHTHPDFQRAYPDLANVQSRLRIDPNVKERGMFSPGQVSVETSLKSTAKSQFFHEFQHLIDYIEGFARGGSPYEFFIKPGVTPQDAIERYKRLAGEVAADNVKQRLYMNDKQRALRPPSWSEERYVKIPRDQQDVRFSRDVFPHAPPPHGTRYTGGVGHGR